jgi:hypothetical protein
LATMVSKSVVLLSTELGEWDRLADDVLLYTTVPWTGVEVLAEVKCGGDRSINTRSSLPARGGAVWALGRLFSLLCNLLILCLGPGNFLQTLGHLRVQALRDCSLLLLQSLFRGLVLLMEFRPAFAVSQVRLTSRRDVGLDEGQLCIVGRMRVRGLRAFKSRNQQKLTGI